MQAQSGMCSSSSSSTIIYGTTVTAPPTHVNSSASGTLTFNDSTPVCGDANVGDPQTCVDRCREVTTNTYGNASTQSRIINGKFTSEWFFKTKECKVR
jgi:hypothetical protein